MIHKCNTVSLNDRKKREVYRIKVSVVDESRDPVKLHFSRH